MSEHIDPDDERIERQLVDIEKNPAASVDTTVRGLHGELETLAENLRQPASTDPHEAEPACQSAVEQLRALAAGHTVLSGNDASTGDADEPQDGTVLGQYQLLGRLGQGGMGTVYKALHTRLDKIVALKVLPAGRVANASAVGRFEREMKAVGRIDHPHLVRALDAGVADGMHYLVMEYADGVDLSQIVKQHGAIPVAAACELIRQAAFGLQAAHERGMIHRDVKPANLILARQEFGPPVVKVLDLGLALLAEELEEAEPGLTADGQVMGTLDYMAPEQAGDSHSVDAGVDVYSLGATLFALLTGRPPYHGPQYKSHIQKLNALANEPIPDVRELRPDVPEFVANVVERMLAKDRTDRYATMAEVAEALALFAEPGTLTELLSDAPSDFAQAPPSISFPPAAGLPASGSTAETFEITPVRSTSSRRTRQRPPVFIAAAVLLLFAPLAWLYGGTVIRYVTNHGELVIEVDDPNVEVKIINNGEVVELRTQKREITLKPGKGEIHVHEKDGVKLTTREFELTRGGKTTVRVTMKQLADARGRLSSKDTPSEPRPSGSDPTNADRRAAAAVLSVGGRVEVKTANDEPYWVESARKLPQADFTIEWIEVERDRAGEISVNWLRDVLAGAPKVEGVALHEQSLGDAVAPLLATSGSLKFAMLSEIGLTDRGLAELTSLSLLELNVGKNRVGDAGVKALGEQPRLRNLVLTDTDVTDKALEHIGRWRDLRSLTLGGVPVTDRGLAHLAPLKKLAEIDLEATMVTSAGVKRLHQTLPGCRIEWNGGVIESQSATGDADRRAAEFVLSLGGTVRVNGLIDDVKIVDDLPKKAYRLTYVNLYGNQKLSDVHMKHFKDCKDLKELTLHGTRVTDAGLAWFKGRQHLTHLNVSRTKVGDDGLANFRNCRNLVGLSASSTNATDAGLLLFRDCRLMHLHLGDTKVTDKGLAEFTNLKNLESLHLDDTAVSDEGLSHFRDCSRLNTLDLSHTGVTDAGLAHFKNCKSMMWLHLDDTQISDAGLPHLSGLANLASLELRKTKVTAEGVAALQKALPRCKVEWEGLRQ